MGRDSDIDKFDPKFNSGGDKEKPFGRPPKYGADLLKQAYEYIVKGWKETGQQIPSLVGLALYLGVASSTVHKWKNDKNKKDFSDICESVMDMQHLALLNNGLTGVFVSPVTKMILTKHGYSDKIDSNKDNIKKIFIEVTDQDMKDADDHIDSVIDL